jgi:hypothetical protein
MALHCAATLLLVPHDTAGGHDAAELALLGGLGAVLAPALPEDADVVEELQALADLHRGERVVVPVSPTQRGAALAHLGRTAAAAPGRPAPLRLEVGDDGWVLLPTEA